MHIEIQGGLVKIHGTAPVQENSAKRGNVLHFSNKSRKRLLEMIARLSDVKQALFLTLTYGQQFPTENEANKHLKAFIRRLREVWPRIGIIWRRELQKRGAPHFHLIIFNVPYIPKRNIALWWSESIPYECLDFSGGEPLPPFTRIEQIDNKKKAMLYVSKYVAKVAEVDTGFNDMPYQNGGQSKGRFWGITGREFMPFAVLFEIALGSMEVFKSLMLVAQLTYKKMRRYRAYCGATIFCENKDSPKWIEDTFTAQEAFIEPVGFDNADRACTLRGSNLLYAASRLNAGAGSN